MYKLHILGEKVDKLNHSRVKADSAARLEAAPDDPQPSTSHVREQSSSPAPRQLSG